MDSPGELRVLLRAATAKDSDLIVPMLQREGIETKACSTPDDILGEMAAGAGALIIAEEVVQHPAFAGVMAALQAQPDWSDLPVIVLARTGADSPAIAKLMEALAGSVTVLERPMRVASFVSAARAALASRKRQYVLRTTLEGLREADQRKTEFLATLAHELRNPLAPVRTALAVLMTKELDPAQSRRFFEMMNRQVDHMARLIDDLLEVARITRGKIALQIHPVDLVEVVRDAAD
ncbi:MAG TPA: histidine kinase dimerization/phospho-acceptor domain-containing protein, partial [Ramlibacter sp.]|nr:histidine kinase dimerization/phospho-acceptor domain-containing protein [Ramlibacter sp.]